MKQRVKWIAAGVVAYLIFLLAYLPAEHIVKRLPLPAHTQIQGVSGTIWNGRASSALLNGLPVDDLQWSLSPWYLLTASLHAQLTAGDTRDTGAISLRGPVTYSLVSGTTESEDLSMFLPVDLVIAQLPLPIPVNAGGRFKLDLEEMVFSSQCVTLAGQGQWLNASVSGTQGAITLGNFTADLTCDSGDIVVSVKQPNSFGLDADARVSPEFNVSVDGQFKPDDTLPREVHQAAKFFGQPDAQGFYRIRF